MSRIMEAEAAGRVQPALRSPCCSVVMPGRRFISRSAAWYSRAPSVRFASADEHLEKLLAVDGEEGVVDVAGLLLLGRGVH